MGKDIHINVHHITRVEGHGNIIVNVSNGTIERCDWQVPEAPRFFEAMVKGRHYSEVARITSRICGICSVGHTLASIKATEAALGIHVTKQTDMLRRILKMGELFDSHAVHLYILVTPDLVGLPSVFPLVDTSPEIVKMALRVKRVGSDWAGLFSGRSTHPTTIVPGGYTRLPTNQEIRQLKEKILSVVPDVATTLQILKDTAHKFPQFNRPTEYVGLVDDFEYGLYDGNIGCMLPDGSKERIDLDQYRTVTNEYVTPLSTAKYTKHKMGSYMAGALARINLNFDRLHPEAKKIAGELGFKTPSFSPYMNNIAQFIELVHCAYTGIEYMDQILEKGIQVEEIQLPTKFGKGAGGVEVPRGILFHEYMYDEKGFCQGGDCVIPTNQNHGNIQLDFEKLVPEMLEQNKSQDDMRLSLEMLVRSYDPCISCSTHYLDVTFVK